MHSIPPSASRHPTQASIMKISYKSLLSVLLPVIFWLGAWQLYATYVDSSFLLPTIGDTFAELYTLIGERGFYLTVLTTLIRVIIGLSLGTVVGILFAMLSHRFYAIRVILTPAITVIKSTPVASFIVILWIMMSGSALAIFIAFLMVMPLIWQNLMDGYAAIDTGLTEVADVFGFSYAKRLRLLVFPTLIKYLVPALITSVGLAWKSEIAAEIIAYTKNSIGYMINNAKTDFDTPRVFAWTIIIIVMSILLEFVTKMMMRMVSSWH